jgi:hypothetical protein
MKAQAQTIPKINGTKPGVKLPFENIFVDEEPHEKNSSSLDTPISSSPF